MSVDQGILLQKSKVATVRLFGKNLKRAEIDDSYSRSRATEVAYEFSARLRGPSGPYAKTTPTPRRILDPLYKMTFATVSGADRKWLAECQTGAIDPTRTSDCVDLC
jgi:hypothetical protein